MKTRRFALALAACAIAAIQAHALLSINVANDDALVPGWVVNTFTLDSDNDITSAVALTKLSSGSMLNIPGYFPDTRSNGPGDSYYSINNDPNTNGGLGPGDLGGKAAFFDENGIGMAWYNIRSTDFGTGLHLMTLTFSADTAGELDFMTSPGEGHVECTFEITDGLASILYSYIKEPGIKPKPTPKPEPEPKPDPDPDPGPGGGLPGDSYPDHNPIPEPVYLALLGIFVAVVGGTHRRRPLVRM